MPIDNRTANLNLPLPNAANDLIDDVQRLREAFIALDTKLHNFDVLLSSDDLSLDTVQEIVTGLKTVQTGLSSLTTSVNSQIASLTTTTTAALAAQTTTVNNALTAQSDRMAAVDVLKATTFGAF